MLATWRFLQGVAAETPAPPFRALGDAAAHRFLVPSNGLATRGLLQGVTAETSVPSSRACDEEAGTPRLRGVRFGSVDKERGRDFCGVASKAENSQENNKSSSIVACQSGACLELRTKTATGNLDQSVRLCV